jgi:hypothetical protein
MAADPFFVPMVVRVVENKFLSRSRSKLALQASRPPEHLTDLTAVHGEELGCALTIRLATTKRGAEEAVRYWIEGYPALVSFKRQAPWMEPMCVTPPSPTPNVD